jgi:diguanylate cyclase (GGDEF)-like protein/PAS domain S-box-containing protein
MSRSSREETTIASLVFTQGSEDDARYRTLFDQVPVSIWQEDWSSPKSAVEELRRQGVSDFDAYFQSHPDVLQRIAGTNRVVDVNPAAIRMYGTPERASFRPFGGASQTEDELRAYRRVLSALASGETDVVVEVWEKTYDGADICVRDSVVIPNGFTDSWERVIHTAEEITQGKRAERALLDSEERFRYLIEGSIQGILIQQDSRPLFANKAFAEIHGYESPAELLSLDSSYRLVAPHELERLRAYGDARIRSEAAPSHYEYEAVRRDGSTVTLQNVVRVISWDGRPAVQSTVVEITERKRAEAALAVRVEFERLIGTISTNFINLSSAEIGKGIEQSLELIGTMSDVDRICMLELRAGGRVVRDAHEYCVPGVQPIGVAVETDLSTALPWLAQQLDEHRTLYLRRLDDLPREACREREHFESTGIRSLVVMPMVAREGVVGLLCLESLRAEKVWSEDALTYLRLIAEIFVNALERNRTEHALRESEERYSLAMRAVSDVLYDWNIREDEVYFAADVGDLLGIPSEDLLDASAWMERLHPEDRPVYRRKLIDHLKGKSERFECQPRYRDAHGDWRWAWQRGYALRDEHGYAHRMVGSVSDISEEKRALEALASSEQRHQDLYDNAPDIYFTVSDRGTVLSVNQFGADYLGYQKDDLIGHELWRIVHESDVQRVRGQVRRLFSEDTAESEMEFRTLCKDGSILWVHERVRLVRDASQLPSELRMVCRDITEQHRLSEQLSYQASHDALTGLVNRREFEQRLRRVLGTARTQDGEHALCYLDLDQFKLINDTCGHLAGDELLRQLSSMFAERIRKRDTLARLGGDEFGILMEHCALEQAQRVAETLRAAVEEFKFGWEENTFNIGVSIGVVPISSTIGDMTSVLRAADTACYAAKEAGRNRIHVYEEGDAEVERRFGEARWVTRINRALSDERFLLTVQPIIAAETVTPIQSRLPLEPPGQEGETDLYEVLLRMQDEKGGTILPGAFLPAAERYNLAASLDQWVIGATLDWFSKHPDRLRRLFLCSINLSGQSLADEGFPTFVTGQLDHTKIPAHKLCFEITETAAVANLAAAKRAMKILGERGCRFALDDFGCGLSSFAYLKTLPVDYLKIDGMFVKDIMEDPIDLAMVKSINEIGKVMGKHTIAEFVESEAILAKLREIGVDYVQGFATGRPCPIEELA